MSIKKTIQTACILLSISATQPQALFAQIANFDNNKYEIVDVAVKGVEYLDEDILKVTVGLLPGDRIYLQNDPAVAKAIRNLWDQKLLEDIQVNVVKTEGKRVWLEVVVKERPRLGNVSIKGVRSTMETELKQKLKLSENRMITDALKIEMQQRSKNYLASKGFFNSNVTVKEISKSPTANIKDIEIIIEKGIKVQVGQINFYGNQEVADGKLKKAMKGTKEAARLSLKPIDTIGSAAKNNVSFKNYIKGSGFLSLSKTLTTLNPYFRYNVFANSKYNEEKFGEDKQALIEYYNTLGYRDAQIVSDTIRTIDAKNVAVNVNIKEGRKYYFGDIEFRGNTLYSDSLFYKILRIEKGDIYNRALLDKRLGAQASMDSDGDIGSLYLDNGHLFFRIDAVEKSIINDTINYVVNITEGPEATIKNVEIFGNQKTNDHVLRRELFTLPGDKFSRADLIRSIRQISVLGFIDPEKVTPDVKPNPSDYTTDINYIIAEKSSDQLEISAGYNGYVGVSGSIGLVFNNFSIKNIFNTKAWSPLPMGDGQKLSLRWQSSGFMYNSGTFSFTEPWLGGKKPNSLTVGLSWIRLMQSTGMSIYSPDFDRNNNYITNFGANVSLGRRLSWPDDYFVLSVGLNYQNYYLKNYTNVTELFTNGSANNLFARISISRSSLDQMIFPKSGSNISLNMQFTPPYSLFSEKNYSQLENKEKYRWIEYHKYRFNAEFYQKIHGNLILKFAAKYGFLGYYNKELGMSPFERFQLGGDGLSGYNFVVGKDIISQRGYEIYQNNSAPIFNKYVLELRYPFSLNPSATIFGLVFAEGANVWSSMKNYNPLELNRSVGVGVRVYLPMFGLLGLDYGFGIDRYSPGMKFGSAAKFTFMLGMEPD